MNMLYRGNTLISPPAEVRETLMGFIVWGTDAPGMSQVQRIKTKHVLMVKARFLEPIYLVRFSLENFLRAIILQLVMEDLEGGHPS